jgi:uncharacterized protein with GYD domain
LASKCRDSLTAAAISLAVAGAGATKVKTIELLTSEQIDHAMKKHVHCQVTAVKTG